MSTQGGKPRAQKVKGQSESHPTHGTLANDLWLEQRAGPAAGAGGPGSASGGRLLPGARRSQVWATTEADFGRCRQRRFTGRTWGLMGPAVSSLVDENTCVTSGSPEEASAALVGSDFTGEPHFPGVFAALVVTSRLFTCA
jgi:hypothetical protein